MCSSWGLDPYCTHSTQFILLFRVSGLNLLHCSCYMRWASNTLRKGTAGSNAGHSQASFCNVCPKAVTISKLPSAPLCWRTAGSPAWQLAHLQRQGRQWSGSREAAAHTGELRHKERGLAWRILCGRGSGSAPSEGAGGLAHRATGALAAPSGRPHIKAALTWKGRFCSQLTCQVQLQRAGSSSTDQRQFGHHHVWSVRV